MEHQRTLPKTFTDGRTPEAWCALLEEMHGLKLSARKLRQLAREMGQMDCVGKDMLLRANHVDSVVEEMTCRLNRTKEAKPIGFVEGSKNSLIANTSEKALARLRKQARKR